MDIRTRALKQAEKELLKRKCVAEQKAAVLTEKAYSEYPQLLETVKKQESLRAEMLSCAISGKKDTKLLSEKAAVLSREYSALIEKIFSSHDALEPEYVCQKCGDTGYIDGKQCDCLKRLVNRYISESFCPSKAYRDCRFDNFSLEYYSDASDDGASERRNMKTVFDYCRAYADDFSMSSRSILMTGNTGLGKTHLSMAIASAVSESGYCVIYGSAQNLLKKIEDEHFGRADGDTLGELDRCDLLVFDDLGTEFSSQFNSSAVYDIINSRILDSRPTIISTNLSLADLVTRYTDRIVSRIAYYYDMLRFFGADIRIAKRRNIDTAR